eukprot:GDKJ01012544.1.p1 GENE.GDKJ01012544.1~~GDKJ01012544.1.p1  ORF type:complete len:897 (-),score=258.90 GDKJ01012544.1:283-2973(-)
MGERAAFVIERMSNVNTPLESLLREHEETFVNFMEAQYPQMDEVLDEVLKNQGRYILDLSQLNAHFPGLSLKIINEPAMYIEPFSDGLRRLMDEHKKMSSDEKMRYHVGFTGAFGRHHITPRGLNSKMINKMVMVEGVVTRMSVVRPLLQQSAVYAPSEKRMFTRDHPNLYRITKRDQSRNIGIMRTSPDGAPVEAEYGLCTYLDTQTLTLQEVPERAPTGQLPCSVEVHLQEDLVDRCKPGDRIVIVGTFKAMTGAQSGFSNGIAKQVLVANDVKRTKENITHPHISEMEMSAIRAIAAKEDAFDFLGRSFAPSIYGHENIKLGLLLMLLGGHERVLSNGAHLRGDSHVMMLGDPSCGKSQLLRFVMNVAPLAISTTGRGTTGVGLTAAVTIDKESNQRQLEAGAMVLADRGIVCIDEFDKMTTADRVSIHEAMEQQTVTIAKAGIHAELHARCTVLAAANPRYGHISPDMSLSDQIDFPDSLLSRFDLIFIVHDLFDVTVDRRIARFVLGRNKNLVSGSENSGLSAMTVNEMTAVIEVDDSDMRKQARETEDSQISLFEKVGDTEIAKLPLLRKYIYYAKHVHEVPLLSDAAINMITKKYVTLREKTRKKNRLSTITTRTLEGIIRLSTAHAKLKLRKQVEEDDVRAACRLVFASILGKEGAVIAQQHDDEEEFDANEWSDDENGDEEMGGGGDSETDEGDDGHSPDEEGEEAALGSRAMKRRKRKLEEADSEGEGGASDTQQETAQRKRMKATSAVDLLEQHLDELRRMDEEVTAKDVDMEVSKAVAQGAAYDLLKSASQKSQKDSSSAEVSQDHPVFSLGTTVRSAFNSTVANFISRGEVTLEELIEHVRKEMNARGGVESSLTRAQVVAVLNQLNDDIILIDGDIVYPISG